VGHGELGAILLPPAAEATPGDLTLARRLWLLLVTNFSSFLPLTAARIFLPVMALDIGTSAAIVGGLRGLGGYPGRRWRPSQHTRRGYSRCSSRYWFMSTGTFGWACSTATARSMPSPGGSGSVPY
jgi:hypothetical protein